MLDFRAALKARQDGKGTRRKGDITRDRLDLAAVEILEEKGYRNMRVSDITQAADVSNGTFYVYYKNKQEITLHVLEEFLEELGNYLKTGGKYPDPFSVLYQSNLAWFRSMRANAGLFRCILQLGDELPEFADFMHATDKRWYHHVARGVIRQFPNGSVDESVAALTAYSLGSMMDALGRRLVVYPDPYLQNLLKDIAPSDEDFAEFLSTIWFRSLYGVNPPQELSCTAAKMLASIKRLE